jgi:hypothetical protein
MQDRLCGVEVRPLLLLVNTVTLGGMLQARVEQWWPDDIFNSMGMDPWGGWVEQQY